ncbi:MAG: hypothetical protein HQ515_08850 [Phycisphaeraceae bacterium]|nr:hypothetical protein [Phycisphaeraceae bacterium]
MVIHGTTAVHLTDEIFDQTLNCHHALEGWLTSEAYHDSIERSIVVAPLLTSQSARTHRLGPEGEILYSTLDDINNTELGPVFDRIEAHLKIKLVYGFQTVLHPITRVPSRIETLLLDVRHMNRSIVNTFKRELFEDFGIQSHRFEHLWQYEQSVRLAPAAMAALEALNAMDDMTTIISHNYTSVPTLLCAMQKPLCHVTTVFCAHEVPSIREIVEAHPGHDTMFYNVMGQALRENLYIDEVFGEPCHTFQHTLTQAASHCHRILASGHNVAREMRFLDPGLQNKTMDIMYDGLAPKKINLAERHHARNKLKAYCEELLSYTPDWVFSHVAKRIKSKALWRDLRVLSALDREFLDTGQTGVMYMVCTDATRRPARDILQMEVNYGWPVAHREGLPDLIGDEIPVFDLVQAFNARARNIKVLFINQDGFDTETCGQHMPTGMTPADLRQGTDVEFCLSIYEPFGSSQLEPMAYGGLCVLNQTCGCTEFFEAVAQGVPQNALIADYTNVGDNHPNIEDALRIGQSQRDQVEQTVCGELAEKIWARLPKTDAESQALLETGSHLAEQMHWNTIIRNYLYPMLQNNLVSTHR